MPELIETTGDLEDIGHEFRERSSFSLYNGAFDIGAIFKGKKLIDGDNAVLGDLAMRIHDVISEEGHGHTINATRYNTPSHVAEFAGYANSDGFGFGFHPTYLGGVAIELLTPLPNEKHPRLQRISSVVEPYGICSRNSWPVSKDLQRELTVLGLSIGIEHFEVDLEATLPERGNLPGTSSMNHWMLQTMGREAMSDGLVS